MSLGQWEDAMAELEDYYALHHPQGDEHLEPSLMQVRV